MKFAASYSGGKESALAVHRFLKQGHKPIALITTFNTDAGRSHFHGLSEEVLANVSDAIGIPLWLVKTNSADYAQNFEAALLQAKEQGAEACVFGDIDIEGHREWCSQLCENIGIKAIFPLWGETRKSVVHEVIDSGFVANISVVNTKYLGDEFLGQRLTKDLADRIAAAGADICGENGEYHTFVSAGPIFKHPVDFSFGDMIKNGDYAMLPVKKKYKACPELCERADNTNSKLNTVKASHKIDMSYVVSQAKLEQMFNWNSYNPTCDFAILVDEAASLTGLLRAMVADENLRNELRFVCEIIYNLSPSFRKGVAVVTKEELAQLEKITIQHKKDAALSPGTVVLPMGAKNGALSHVLRVKCKGLVRLLCRHGQTDGLLLDFANLLSGYFYYLAFKLNASEGIDEVPYIAPN